MYKSCFIEWKPPMLVTELLQNSETKWGQAKANNWVLKLSCGRKIHGCNFSTILYHCAKVCSLRTLRHFSLASPYAWNCLWPYVCRADVSSCIKSHLKAQLFWEAFCTVCMIWLQTYPDWLTIFPLYPCLSPICSFSLSNKYLIVSSLEPWLALCCVLCTGPSTLNGWMNELSVINDFNLMLGGSKMEECLPFNQCTAHSYSDLRLLILACEPRLSRVVLLHFPQLQIKGTYSNSTSGTQAIALCRCEWGDLKTTVWQSCGLVHA